MSLLEEGQEIRNTYEVERLIGEGAFAEVYRVRHKFLGLQAMKVFKTVGMTFDETMEMLGEAILLTHIGHPNIICVHEANTTETSKGTCGFFTMEYVAGGSLDQYWQSFKSKYIPIEKTVDIMRQICRGLSVAHEEDPPIIHRDIKPQNILVGYAATGLRVRVCDFGLAKRINPLTLMASARGTKHFKAPEVFRDPQSDSRAGDVWALGTTLYMLLTDRFPFTNPEDPDHIDYESFKKPLILPSRLNILVDPLLEDIVLRALAIDPAERYISASDLLENLMKWKPRPADFILHPPSAESSATEKTVLGIYSPGDEKQARKMAESAIALSRQIGKLTEAADLMEQAFNKWPEIREQYEYKLRLWRRGITR